MRDARLMAISGDVCPGVGVSGQGEVSAQGVYTPLWPEWQTAVKT